MYRIDICSYAPYINYPNVLKPTVLLIEYKPIKTVEIYKYVLLRSSLKNGENEDQLRSITQEVYSLTAHS